MVRGRRLGAMLSDKWKVNWVEGMSKVEPFLRET